MTNPLRQRARQQYNDEPYGDRVEREFIEQLDAYYSDPRSSFYLDRLEKEFYKQRLNHVGFKPYPKDGLVTFGASGTDKCDLEVYYRNQKIKPEKRHDLPFRGRQRRQGSAIIEMVQLDLIHMPARLGNRAKFTVKKTKSDEYAFEDAAQHRAVYEVEMEDGYKCRFAITAKPDGILEYEGKSLLFEYKTKAAGLRAMNGKLDFKGPDEGHMRQVTAESLVFGISEGILLYESTQKPSWFSDEERKSVTKGQKTWKEGAPLADVRAFYFTISADEQHALLHHLAKQARNVYENTKPTVTPEMTNKCAFCDFFGSHCQGDQPAEVIENLRQVERRMASSHMAGKFEHRNLVEYLSAVPEEGL